MAELQRDRRGYLTFRCQPDEIADVVAGVPAATLRAEYERLWERSPLPTPELSDRALRAALLAELEEQARLEPAELVLALDDALAYGRQLFEEQNPRQLLYAIQGGEYADAVRTLKDGSFGLAFEPPPRLRILVGARSRVGPDPRREFVAQERARAKGRRL